ncbi:MAG TPA: ATP-binding cassette domain-containing protein [Chloroflexota bacterium]|nr:ATP-binding cassette domain-containing protein [Chloroflexota bacterium]
MIEVSDLSFGYARPDEIFQNFGWHVARGESWAVLGPSGCGKTTLVYLLAGLRHPSAGTVMVDGAGVTSPRTSTGLILQDHGLLPWAKARDNVALGLKIRRVPRPEMDEKVDYWMERLGIAAVADRYPGQLSGGQRQRVAIARTLALSPSLLLMDEPFSSLDSTTREDLQELVVSLSGGSGVTTVLVTHDIQEAVFLGQRIMIVGRAPIHGYGVVENPYARRSEYRRSPDFFQRCAEVRTLAAELMNGVLPPQGEALTCQRTCQRGEGPTSLPVDPSLGGMS